MPFLQDWIHKLEEGVWARYVKIAAFGVAILFLGLTYDFRAYRNFATPEAMDSAQLARNLAEGKGYTTLFIRPFSLYLVQSHNQAQAVDVLASAGTDFAKIKTPHPDIANPPVYPLALAGLMKVLPFHYPLNLKNGFWSNGGSFWRYEPDFLIASFNEVLLLVVVGLTFFLARRLFDNSVAWLSAFLVLGCELLWRFSVSGLSTMLLLVIFIGLMWCILWIEEAASDPQSQFRRLLGLAIAAGVVVGAGALTRYAFGWVIIPVALYLILFGGQRGVLHALAASGAFALVLAPWIIRNFAVSGTPFGTAGFAVVEGTGAFPGFQLERSLQPDLSSALGLGLYVHKFLDNLRPILQDTLPKLGGSWVSMLFLTGLLLNFRSSAVRRMRYFLLMCLALFIVVQALGRTQLSEESPEINSENLLVLLVPLVFVYGVSLFLILLEQMALPLRELRYVVKTVFVALCCAPMIFALLPPRAIPVVYPPYYPPDIQLVSGWMKPNELMMSDVPWAVAWYGQRQCTWLSLNAQDDFFAINDYLKPVQALYLTPETMDAKFASDWVRADEHSWGNFVLQAVAQGKIPTSFPLVHAPTGFFPERMFLTDADRWKLQK
jgi:4-amino-4-deoxy-L-arabinose transferase-like glycosyltransferase